MVKVIDNAVVSRNADAQARRALDNAQRALKYYRNGYGRDSFDGQGTRVVNVVHSGKNFANAFWSPVLQIMGYGDGDGVQLGDMTLSADVAGHELTHAVVSSTANLQSEAMSGALNEAIADLFGEAIEGRYDWIMGPDVMVRPADRATGIRNLADPSSLTFSYLDASGRKTTAAYPTKVSDYLPLRAADGSCLFDRCGVHINSTIISHTGYRMHKTIGKDAERIWYATLTGYLTPLSTFEDFGRGTQAACEQLFGASSTQCKAVVRILLDQGYNLPDSGQDPVRTLNLR